MTEHKLFKINQDAIIKNVDGEVLILKQEGKWKLPGGRMEDNETPQEGLLREIREETGIANCNIEQVVNLGLSESGNTYRVTFLCNTPERTVALSDEHAEFAWVNKTNVENYDFAFGETKDMLLTFMQS